MRGLLLFLMLISINGYAGLTQSKAHGFHWYSVDTVEKKPKIEKKTQPMAPPVLSPYEKLMEIRKETLNKLASALINPSLNTTYDYMKAQQVYAEKNQKFVQFWQQALLIHPELDHSLNFPTDNSAIALKNEETNQLIEKILNRAKDNYGLIFYYKGNSALSQKFSLHLMPFVNQYQFSMISVSTDGIFLPGLPNPKDIPLALIQQTMDLKARYLPALFLVNLKTQQMRPLSYGFISLSELKERFLDVATQYKRFSYQGLGGE